MGRALSIVRKVYHALNTHSLVGMLFVWCTVVINHTAVYDVILDVITDVKITGKMQRRTCKGN